MIKLRHYIENEYKFIYATTALLLTNEKKISFKPFDLNILSSWKFCHFFCKFIDWWLANRIINLLIIINLHRKFVMYLEV